MLLLLLLLLLLLCFACRVKVPCRGWTSKCTCASSPL
jgi:hypothetical protein